MYKEIESNKRKTFLLVAGFIIVVLFIGWTFAEVTEAGYPALVIAGVFAILMSLGGYYKGDKVALMSSGAKGPITKTESPYLYRMVENLSITAGLPMPKVYLINEKSINAFATGRDPQHASIAVTTGAVDKLENEELEGVIAHELSHIKNYDILLMTVVLVLVGLLALLGDWFIRIHLWGGGKKNNNSSGQLQFILIAIGVVLIILSPIIGKIIQLAISRKREFLADASAALLTRYPEGLAKALEKISLENMPMKKANNATAHLFFSSPFGRSKHLMSNLFATHPPVQERIISLRKMI